MRASWRAVAVGTVMAVSACGSGGGGEGDGDSEKAAKPVEPKGVAVAATDDFEDVRELHFLSPRSGKPTLTVQLPDGGSAHQMTKRQTYSADWKRMAWKGRKSIVVGKLDPKRKVYRETAEVKRPGSSFSGGNAYYDNPQISPDGSRVFFERTTDGEEKTTVVSVPVNKPNSTPREEFSFDDSDGEKPAEMRTWMVDGEKGGDKALRGEFHRVEKKASDGRVVETLKYVEANGRIVDAQSEMNSRGGQAVDSRHMFVIEDKPPKVRMAALNGEGKAELEKAVPDGEAEVSDAVTSPDGKTTLLRTQEGWYRAPAENTKAEPKRAFSKPSLPNNTDLAILDWS